MLTKSTYVSHTYAYTCMYNTYILIFTDAYNGRNLLITFSAISSSYYGKNNTKSDQSQGGFRCRRCSPSTPQFACRSCSCTLIDITASEGVHRTICMRALPRLSQRIPRCPIYNSVKRL